MQNIDPYFAKALKKLLRLGDKIKFLNFFLPSASISTMTMSLLQFGGWFLDPKVDTKKEGMGFKEFVVLLR